MKPLTLSEKEEIMSRLFWDVDKAHVDLSKLLDETAEDIEDIEQQNIYRRLLVSCDWYTLLKLLPLPKIKAVLNSSVLDRLYPKDLKSRYMYARDILSKQGLSHSG